MKTMKFMVSLSLCGLLLLMTSCGDLSTLGEELFNTNFLTDIGAETGTAQTQVTPDLKKYVLLKALNQTSYPAYLRVVVKRSQASEEPEVYEFPLGANQSIGQLITGCDSTTNSIRSMYIPDIGDDEKAAEVVGNAYVLVAGLPVLVPAVNLPGVLNVGTDFNCGDTVEFVVTTSFSDVDRYQVSALIFEGTVTDDSTTESTTNE
jgi:hypothetical protein